MSTGWGITGWLEQAKLFYKNILGDQNLVNAIGTSELAVGIPQALKYCAMAKCCIFAVKKYCSSDLEVKFGLLFLLAAYIGLIIPKC